MTRLTICLRVPGHVIKYNLSQRGEVIQSKYESKTMKMNINCNEIMKMNINCNEIIYL